MMKITTGDFGLGASLIKIENSQGVEIAFTNLGARIVSWRTNGKNIVLGFDSAEEYLKKDVYPGAVIGRTAGRIAEGKFSIAGKTYQLQQNEGGNTLHGGNSGFESKLWRFETFSSEAGDSAGVNFFLTSNEGENGFPGQLEVRVTYTFDEDNRWTIEYHAASDKDTIFNPTNHVYFNLSGDVSQPIDEHQLMLKASRLVPLRDKTEVVRGDIIDITETDLDFRSGKRLSTSFMSQMEQVELVGGIDHPFLLDEPTLMEEQARLTLDDQSISVYTDASSIVIFTANFGDSGPAYHGKKIVNHGGITFECQTAPGSGQIPEIDSIVLPAGQEFHGCTIYQLNQE
jgi:aldose 1-epimerase